MADVGPSPLERFAAPVLEQLPPGIDVEHIFTPENLPVAPAELVTNQVIVLKARRGRDSTEPVVTLAFYGGRNWFREAGIWILSTVFRIADYGERSSQSDSTVRISNADSEIRALHLKVLHPVGYRTRPLSYSHWSLKLESRYPLPDTQLLFALTDEGGFISQWERELHERDEVTISGDDHELLRLASLFLNIAIANFQDWPNGSDFDGEWHLEGPPGFGGVRTGSAEPSFLLEGSIAWVRDERPRQSPASTSLLHDLGRHDRIRLNRLPEHLRKAAVDELATTPRYPRPEVEAILAKYEDLNRR